MDLLVPPALDPAETLHWLYERARIGDVLNRFAYYLDTKQWDAYMALFAEDGALELPWGTVTRAMMVAAGGPRLLMSLHQTHHVSANHRFEIDGEVARSNSYLVAMHVVRPDEQSSQWAVGGWYDNTYRLADNAWQIVTARLTLVWESGERPG